MLVKLQDTTCMNAYMGFNLEVLCIHDYATCSGQKRCRYEVEYRLDEKLTVEMFIEDVKPIKALNAIYPTVKMVKKVVKNELPVYKDYSKSVLHSFQELREVWYSLKKVDEKPSIPKSSHPLYNKWKMIVGYCHNETYTNYASYGGKGIVVCPEWHDFYNFISAFPDFSKGDRLERINKKGHFEPSNMKHVKK